jgi:raffinose/stachyose/melibiose transport system permease protein
MARYTWRTFGRELTLLFLAALWWVPFYFLVTISLKSDTQSLQSPLSLPTHLDFGNYSRAWRGANGVSLGQALKSSLIITSGSVLCLIAFGSVAAYTIGRRSGKLSNALYGMFVLGIILPFQLGLVPAYVALRGIGLQSSYFGLIILYTALLLPLVVFLYTGFVRTLPRDYEEAAQVDGASGFRTFWRVVFPLLRPVTGTAAILTALIVWNDFFTPLIFLSGTSKETLPVAIYGFVGVYATLWNLVFAAVAVSILPMLVFFLVAQRQLIRGFTGGIKT